MKLENQVCKFELARQSEAPGIFQQGIWYHIYKINSVKVSVHRKKTVQKMYGNSLKKFGEQSNSEIIPAVI
jgi:hypothetical protein